MQVNCPTCQRSVTWNSESEFRPFCSKKCQLIDLGDWATEANSIADPAQVSAPQHMDEEAIAEQFEKMAPAFFKE